MKNLEEYAVERIEKLEAQNERQKENLGYLSNELGMLNDKLTKLKDVLERRGMVKFSTYSDGRPYVWFENIDCSEYNEKEREDYEFLISVLDLRKEGQEEEKEIEDGEEE